jgi:hypothetical protein
MPGGVMKTYNEIRDALVALESRLAELGRHL